ncbi:duboraya isoform X2 [Cheilinus undulatus]|uniref:duboraya isoform X2 n=1 Tax=Cheilinus undulatus TaxID=241271 RepID=UPI001BD63C67|nr:duboraya isoform X2 [Cheilinus undulatus]
MEEEAASRRSVAELAGRFKGSAPPHDAAGEKTDKPVRRRPPRSLQLPKPQTDDREPTGVTSPLPAKAKRNSALIEKLQANLALSPTALLPSPKSPGFRLLPPAFPPQSPGSAPATTPTPSTPAPVSPVVAPPLTKEEGPASFEDPPTTAEGSILSNINKGRARHSIRRRPPSRRHRKSSSGDEVANEGVETCLSSTREQGDKTREEGGGGGGEREEDQAEEVKEEQKDASATNETKEEEKSEINVEPREEEKKDGEITSTRGGEEEKSSSGRKEEEEGNNGGKQDEDSTKGVPNTESREEKSEETCEELS